MIHEQTFFIIIWQSPVVITLGDVLNNTSTSMYPVLPFNWPDVRQIFHNVNNLYDLFTNFAGGTTLKFLKEINIYTNKNNNKSTELRTILQREIQNS